jgi:geranylgeranyl diphosphate synthase type II
MRDYLRDKQALVEQALTAALQPSEGCPASLTEAMRYSLLAPGKRLRPLLVILSAEACGGECVDPLPAACAVEMVHAYSLIHDDLPAMDDDDMRRGQPTCHKKFGEALAILAGDALLTLAFGVLAEGYPPATAAACCRELARGAGACGMVGGQVDDLAIADRRLQIADSMGNRQSPISNLHSLESLHARKTGALFRACLRLGAYVAQGERPGGPALELLRNLDAYGRCFGQAFQITDDLLDVEGSAEQTGKRVQKDAARGKLTYPGFLGIAESRRRAECLVDEAEAHLAPLGPAGDHLAALARMVLDRDK